MRCSRRVLPRWWAIRLGPRRALYRSRRARSSRALSAHVVQERVPEQMPKPARIPPRRLARRSRRGAEHWDGARRLVPGLLLGVDGRAVRSGSHEHRLDGADLPTDRGREAAAVAPPGHHRRRVATSRGRDRRGRSARPSAHAHDSAQRSGDASDGHLTDPSRAVADANPDAAPHRLNATLGTGWKCYTGMLPSGDMASRHPRLGVERDPEVERALTLTEPLLDPAETRSAAAQIRALTLRGAQAVLAGAGSEARLQARLVERYGARPGRGSLLELDPPPGEPDPAGAAPASMRCGGSAGSERRLPGRLGAGQAVQG